MLNKDVNINLPKSWKEITLGMIQEVEGQSDNMTKIISVLSGVDEDTISSLPMSQIERIAKSLEFLKDMPEVEPKPYIKYKGEKYVIHQDTELTFGEYTAVQMAMKGNAHDYCSFLAILARKEGEEYTTSFENTVLQDRVEMFRRIPVLKVLPLVRFFLESWMLYTSIEQTYSQVKATALEEIDNSIQQLGKNSRKNGRGYALRMNYAKRRLKRLMKYIEKTY